MKASARKLDWATVPEEIRPFVSKGQTFTTPEKGYEVHAVSVFEKVTFFLVIDDLDTPVFLPSWAFSLTSKDVPEDWICNTDLGGEVDLVIGPEFIARDLEAYIAMIDQETKPLNLFWRRASSTSSTAADATWAKDECRQE